MLTLFKFLNDLMDNLRNLFFFSLEGNGMGNKCWEITEQAICYDKSVMTNPRECKVMFGNNFCFLFSKTYI